MPEEKARILIAGCRGMLGSEFMRRLPHLYPTAELLGGGPSDFDIAKIEEVEKIVQKFRPTCVINCAAYTAVDKAESEKKSAFQVNFVGVENLKKVSVKYPFSRVQFSTDQVFDGKKTTPYCEDDSANPINFYAYTKYLAEEAIRNHPNVLILRVQWLYGKTKDRFTPLRHLKTFSPFVDQWGAPTWTEKVVDFTIRSVQKKLTGVYHLTHDNVSSWAQVFEFVKDRVNPTLELIPKKTAEVRLPARRPLYCALSNQKIKNDLGDSLGNWQSSLEEFLNTI